MGFFRRYFHKCSEETAREAEEIREQIRNGYDPREDPEYPYYLGPEYHSESKPNRTTRRAMKEAAKQSEKDSKLIRHKPVCSRNAKPDRAYEVYETTAFRKDVKRLKKRGTDLSMLEDVIDTLAGGDPLPIGYRDHALDGVHIGYRECHIRPDWLLIYQIDDDALILRAMRTGSHSDLF